MPECLFCNLLEQANSNFTFILKLKYGSLFLNLRQNYKGRCLHVLNRHQENFHSINDDIFTGFNNEVKKIGNVLYEIFSPDLINYALLGNHIQHIHWHLIPRYKHDSNWGNPPWPYPRTNEIPPNKSKKIVDMIYQKNVQNYGDFEIYETKKLV